MRSLLLLGLMLPTLTSCFPSLDPPESPDLDDLVEQYESPTAAVTPPVVARSVPEILERIEEAEELGLFEQVASVINTLQSGVVRDPNDPDDVAIDGRVLDGIDGVFEVRRVCPGWEGDEIPDPEETGILDLTLLLAGGAFDSVVFGTAERCAYISTNFGRDFQVRLTGEFAGDIQGPLPLGELLGSGEDALATRDFTISYRGLATIDGETAELDSNFRITSDEETEVSLLVDGSRRNFVYFFNENGSVQGLRDVTGRFTCDLEARRCENDSESFTW